MFAALKVSDQSRVTSIATQWDDREEELRELARSGELVCPGCEQLLWLRTGDVRRRHFAHRDLSDCRLGKQSPEVLEAKAQLFSWLELKFPGRVQIDLEIGTSDKRMAADLVVDLEDGKRFTYWIFDRQIRDRSAYPKSPENKTGRTHYIHTESTLKPGPDGGILLSASQRHFISYAEYDLALAKPGLGHLHFFLGAESQLRVYRGLHCIHGPGLHDWEALRTGSLESASICPENGEFIFHEDLEAHEERQRNLAENPPSDLATRTAAKMADRKSKSGTSSKTSQWIDPLSCPYRCEDCGVETSNWSSATPSEGTCVCKECSHKRRVGESTPKERKNHEPPF